MPRKVQIATGKRGGRIAGYRMKDGKMEAIYVSDKEEPKKGKAAGEDLEAVARDIGKHFLDEANDFLQDTLGILKKLTSGSIPPHRAEKEVRDLEAKAKISRDRLHGRMITDSGSSRKILEESLKRVDSTRQRIEDLASDVYDRVDKAGGSSESGKGGGRPLSVRDLESLSMDRKPVSWTSTRRTNAGDIPPGTLERINSLPVIDLGHPAHPVDDFGVKVPQMFVGKVMGQYFLINTEGSNYARYATRLTGWSPSEPSAPAPKTGESPNKVFHDAGQGYVNAANEIMKRAGQVYSGVARGELTPEEGKKQLSDLAKGLDANLRAVRVLLRDARSKDGPVVAIRGYMGSVYSAMKDLASLRKQHDEDMASGKSGPEKKGETPELTPKAKERLSGVSWADRGSLSYRLPLTTEAGMRKVLPLLGDLQSQLRVPKTPHRGTGELNFTTKDGRRFGVDVWGEAGASKDSGFVINDKDGNEVFSSNHPEAGPKDLVAKLRQLDSEAKAETAPAKAASVVSDIMSKHGGDRQVALAKLTDHFGGDRKKARKAFRKHSALMAKSLTDARPRTWAQNVLDF